MAPTTRRRKARPERIRVTLFDDATGSVPLPLPSSRRSWPVGVVFAVFFAIFAAIAVGQIASIRGQAVDSVFDLTFVLFQVFWVLGWSVGVLVLFLLTLLFLFYRESARITRDRLLHVPRLGPLRIIVEYDLARIRNLRVVPSGKDGARIRFDYGDGDNGLGNDLPPAVAESGVRTIQAAVEKLGPGPSPGDEGRREAMTGDATPPPDPRAAPAEPHRPTPEDLSLRSPSALALLGTNLIPLAGILVLGWSLGEVMVLFWAENAVIGFYNLLKMAVIGRWAVLVAGPFFVGHYGGFMAGHFLFVYFLFVRGIETAGAGPGVQTALTDLFVPLWPALLAMFVSHGISFATNFIGRREFVGRKVQDQMAEPYKRIIVMHLTIIFGGWLIMLLRSPLPALILLIALKTAVDLRAHRREHGSGRPAGAPAPSRAAA
jgi:hypothetical protein